MSNINMKNIDVEESYSFSLRNYPGHKPSTNNNNPKNGSVNNNNLNLS